MSPDPPPATDPGQESASGRTPALQREPLPHRFPAWANGIFAGICLYAFLSAINVMGAGLKAIGKNTDWLEQLLAHAENPFVALLGSVLVTATVQSSSFTTSLIITLVATTGIDGKPVMPLHTAIFAIMGANIGTSVTSTIVAFGNVRIRRQFRRAFRAAIVHDIFNWLTVAILFPLEIITGRIASDDKGVLTRFAEWLSNRMGLGEIDKPTSPIKVITKPVVELANTATGWISESAAVTGSATAILGIIMLFISLTLLVRNLKGALLRSIEGLFKSIFFRNDATSYSVGAVTTVLVQSSSVTTSLIVPLAGAGAVKLKRVFPFTLGANLGTTVTGVIAATANPVSAAVTVAVAHVTFNLAGTAIWYPLRRVPIGVARWYGRLASRSRKYAILFLLTAFVLLPVTGLVITELMMMIFS